MNEMVEKILKIRNQYWEFE